MTLRRRKPDRHHAMQSAAYTLIELLIVLVLVGLLMVGVWALLKNWGSLYERGKRRTEKALLVRSLSDQVTDDLHEVTYRPPARGARRRTRATLGNAVGLVGEKDWLVLDILHPIAPYHAAPAMDETAADPNAAAPDQQQWVVRSPELQRVIYWFQPHAIDETSVPLAEDEAPPFFGLLRLAVAREYFADLAAADEGMTPITRGRSSLRSQVALICQTVTTPEEAGASDVAAPAVSEDEVPSADVGRLVWLPGVLQQDEMPEVGWWEFRYHDGTKWQDSWDSRSQGRLPVAVEVKFELVDLPDENAPAMTDEQQAEAQLQDAGDEQTDKEASNAALLEGRPPEWSGQSDAPPGLASSQEETPRYYRCVVYLEPPKKWAQPPGEPDVGDEQANTAEDQSGG